MGLGKSWYGVFVNIGGTIQLYTVITKRKNAMKIAKRKNLQYPKLRFYVDSINFDPTGEDTNEQTTIQPEPTTEESGKGEALTLSGQGRHQGKSYIPDEASFCSEEVLDSAYERLNKKRVKGWSPSEEDFIQDG